MRGKEIRNMTAYYLILCGITLGIAMVASAGDASAPSNSSQPSQTPTVQVRLLDDKGNLTPRTATPKVIKTDDEWRKQLTDEQYRIARGKGTEPAFCGAFYDAKKPGVYYCICCNLPL